MLTVLPKKPRAVIYVFSVSYVQQFSYLAVIHYNSNKSGLVQNNGHIASSMQCIALIRYLGSVLFWLDAKHYIYTSCNQVQLIDLLNFLKIKPTFLNQIVWNFSQKSYKKWCHLFRTPSPLRWWHQICERSHMYIQ